ncbi:DEAD/DEAH box helicase [Mycolicibacterium phocaicum]|uniref:DEAD/DEAH box helicase n=1 Tax=Mycolicibacterium phocaicum TaxID=319706 RepID=UPI001CF9E0E0|nr:DEAD/DEAH box helicase [Mycolicibacterium phocaicum]UCZ62735.1 DEAD/DEAH box helicase [Mycolicibacterium phocaicum]
MKGTDSTAGLALAPHELLRAFNAQTLARGETYANQGRVVAARYDPVDGTLTGSCLGSKSEYYDVEVALSGPRTGLEIEYTVCTCPVGRYCKHAVALLLAAIPSAPDRTAPQRWQVVLGSLLDEMTGTDTDTGGKPLALEFGMLPAGRYHTTPIATLRALTVGKRGNWIKSGINWRRLFDTADPGEFDRDQYSALRALVLAVPGYYPYSSDQLVLSAVGQSFWADLDQAVEAGVTLLPGAQIRAVELAKDVRLRLDFAVSDTGGAQMSTVLVVDGEPRSPQGIGLVGTPTPHGFHQLVDGILHLGAFALAPGPTLLRLIAGGEKVQIPPEALSEFAVDVLPRLRRTVAVDMPEGLFAEPDIVGPLPVLSITAGDVDGHVKWRTRYEVNGQRQEFDAVGVTRTSGIRDNAAEDAMWRAIAPALELISGLSATADPLASLLLSRRLSLPQIAVLCHEVLPQLAGYEQLIVEIDERASAFRRSVAGAQLGFGTASSDEAPAQDWFDLHITIDVDGHPVALSAVIAELALGATHMLLSNGVYFRLDTPELLKLRALIEEAQALGELDGDRVNAASLNATLWDELLGLGVVDRELAQWRDNMARLAAAQPPVAVPTPAGLQAELRDYQRDGLNWLAFLWDNGLGGVLGDDMGLGKTVQTLALISRAVEQGAGKFLVVAPTSVASNWAAECAKFAPGLTTVVVSSTEARGAVPIAEQVAAADIVVTTYTLLRIDNDKYREIAWAGMILDEAQFVKNHHSKTHQCARRLDAPFKLAITGTPMENNLMELWSLLSITVPGLFPSPKIFERYFRRPIESDGEPGRLALLRRRIKPVLLRRTKDQVVKELPPKQEQVLAIELSAKHRRIYDTRLARERQKVLGLLGEWEKNRFQIFRSLTLLRQLSLHPGLVDAETMEAGSTKVDFLIEQLDQLVAEDHSALVFSQFTGFLAILRDRLDAAGIEYSYLDGSVDARGRAQAIDDFSGGRTKVFLISLKAGGFGLNLTAADYCFLCDPWWSPAAEAQAVDRAHRIGQQRPVNVYRLVSENTIEEKVIALQERKRALFAAVIDDGDMFGTAITASDIRELLG